MWSLLACIRLPFTMPSRKFSRGVSTHRTPVLWANARKPSSSATETVHELPCRPCDEIRMLPSASRLGWPSLSLFGSPPVGLPERANRRFSRLWRSASRWPSVFSSSTRITSSTCWIAAERFCVRKSSRSGVTLPSERSALWHSDLQRWTSSRRSGRDRSEEAAGWVMAGIESARLVNFGWYRPLPGRDSRPNDTKLAHFDVGDDTEVAAHERFGLRTGFGAPRRAKRP